MSSRSRSRSPDDSEEVSNSPRNRRGDKRKFERGSRSSGKRSSDCRVYVSNIPYEFKWQDLKDLFRSEVGNVAYVEMFNDDGGRPKGSAIVDFESPEMAQKAVDKMHRMEIKGRKLVVKEREDIVHSRDFMFLFSDRDRNRFGGKDNMVDRRNRDTIHPTVNYGNTYGLSIQFLESLGITGPLVSKVFVANLDYKVTEDDLKEVFKVAGKVTSAEVVKDQDGKSRGFGVVEFEHPLQAVQSISMLHNQLYFDRKISVRLDKVAEKGKKEGSSSKLPFGLKSLGMGLGANGEAITDVNTLSILQQTSANTGALALNNAMGMSTGFNMSAANNMRAGVNTMSMMGLGGMDSMAMGGAGLGMGLAAANVMNMGGLNQNTVPNNAAFGNQGLGMAGGNSANSMFNNTSNFGNSSSDMNSTFNSSNRCVVQINNLPLDYTWKNLKDLCRNYGDIRFAEIKSKGVGWVRFSSESEARRTADLLDRQRFDGRVLDACIV